MSRITGRRTWSNGCLWLGLLSREDLPPRTAIQLDFEGGPEVLPVSRRSRIKLVEWPTWRWRRMDVVTIGGWQDWKLLFWAGERGIWSYSFRPEMIDIVAGKLATWLELLAFEQELDEQGRLKVVFAFPIAPRRQRTPLGARLGLRAIAECSDRRVVSHEGEGLWLRELSPPVGRPFCVARCDTLQRALDLVENAGDALDPRVVAVGSWSACRQELKQELERRGIEAVSGRGLCGRISTTPCVE